MNKNMELLTLEEKIALCSGKNEWDTKEYPKAGIPSVKVADGPHGLRKTIGQGDNLGLAHSYPSTCFPTESLLACSFDESLAEEMGKAIAIEAGTEGVSTILGPGVCIKRNPLCGRNFEYLSEDPYLAGRMAAAYIKGVQSQGIGTSIKHFACNSQEYYRMTSDSRLDERTLREIYLSAFEYAIKEAKPATVMCAYNRINGTSCSDNEFLLNHILREEWGYEGLVVTDWGAINDRIRAFRAGCDLVMPGGSAYEEDDVRKAVQDGTLDEAYITRSSQRVAAFALERKKALSECFKSPYASKEEMYEKAHAIAKKIAEQSAVLLKNEEELLPLKGGEKTVLLGSMAEAFRFQGAGSSKINAVKQESLLEHFPLYAPGYSMKDEEDEKLLQEALKLSETADKVIIVAGLPEQYEAEGIDRRTMALPEAQNRLIREVAEINENVIVVIVSGCAVELPWEKSIKSILWMGLSGQAGAAALAKLLRGDANPCGKLAESWPVVYEDCPGSGSYLRQGKDAIYEEGVFVGYRYYEHEDLPVLYPFGHGLSYTDFNYENLKAEKKGTDYEITVTVRNTGKLPGSEAVLMYMTAPECGIPRPKRELKGFAKVHLAPGEEKKVTFTTDERTFALWNGRWVIYEGNYGIEIGSESVSIELEGEFFDEIQESAAFTASVSWHEETEGFTKESTISDVAERILLLRLVYGWFDRQQAKTFGRDSGEYISAMSAANECPLRALQNMLGMKHHFAQAIADFGNRKYLSGIRNLLR